MRVCPIVAGISFSWWALRVVRRVINCRATVFLPDAAAPLSRNNIQLSDEGR